MSGAKAGHTEFFYTIFYTILLAMKHYLLRIAALSAFAFFVFVHSKATAQTAPTISYQGMLQNNGAAVNGTDTLKIQIYNSASGGSSLYTESQVVTVVNGIFNVAIGSVTPLLPVLDFTKQYYLAVSINGGPELSPRSEVSFAPYAFHALNSDTASIAKTATIANGLSGPFVSSLNGFSGAFTIAGNNGITISNTVSNNLPVLTIGSTGVQSVNTSGGKLTLVGAGGTTITDTGTSITIRSPSYKSVVGSLVNTDSTLAITNPLGPTDTINLARLSANSGQVLEWNGSGWRPATLSNSQGGPDSINQLVDARSFGDNVFLGGQSGKRDRDSSNGTNGDANTAIGISAMQGNTTGYENTACGAFSLVNNTTGYDNTAVGELALFNNDTGSANTAVGFNALKNSTGSGNVAVGQSSLSDNISGNGNIAVGEFALFGNGAGNWNTACGQNSLNFNNGGSYNVAVGRWALYGNTSGNSNIAVGDSSGPTTGRLNNTVCIGSGAQASQNGQVVLGNNNVTSLYCAGAYAATTANSANMVVTSSGQIMRSTSSARYKTNIHDLDINTDKLYDLRPVSYTSKIDGKEYFGLVAEDVAKVLPDLAEYAKSKDVIPGSNSDALIPDAVKYPMLSVLLLEELKKQKQINADLERRLEALEAGQKSGR